MSSTRTTSAEWKAREARARAACRSAMKREAKAQTEQQHEAASRAVTRAASVAWACHSRAVGMWRPAGAA